MIINSTIPYTIAQKLREFMSVKCGALFVIDKMPCGMLSVRWCDIGVMAYLSTQGKTGYKMTVYIGCWNRHLVTFSVPNENSL